MASIGTRSHTRPLTHSAMRLHPSTHTPAPSHAAWVPRRGRTRGMCGCGGPSWHLGRRRPHQKPGEPNSALPQQPQPPSRCPRTRPQPTRTHKQGFPSAEQQHGSGVTVPDAQEEARPRRSTRTGESSRGRAHRLARGWRLQVRVHARICGCSVRKCMRVITEAERRPASPRNQRAGQAQLHNTPRPPRRAGTSM